MISNPTEVHSTSSWKGINMKKNSIFREKSKGKSRKKSRKKSKEKSRKKPQKTSKTTTFRERLRFKGIISTLITFVLAVSKLLDSIQDFYQKHHKKPPLGGFFLTRGTASAIQKVLRRYSSFFELSVTFHQNKLAVLDC